MESLSNKWQFPRWLCASAIILGSAALIIQAIIDIYQGINPAMDQVARVTQIWQMSLPTGFTMVFAAFGGLLLNARRWFMAFCLYALVGCYMAFTASNSMDFMANQTVAVTQAKAAQQTVSKDVAEIKNRLALEERKDMHEGLWRTYATAKTPEAQARILAQIKAASGEALNLQQPEIEVVPIGVGGTANKYLGWRPEAIQEAKVLAFPILMMIGKALGITLGFACWPNTAAERWREAPAFRASPDPFRERTRKVSYADARDDLLSMIQAGAHVASQRELSDRWCVPEGTVSKWMSKIKREGLPLRIEANGNKRAIVAAPHVNGNGRAHA
jgi:hypothetical protein